MRRNADDEAFDADGVPPCLPLLSFPHCWKRYIAHPLHITFHLHYNAGVYGSIVLALPDWSRERILAHVWWMRPVDNGMAE